MTTLILMRHGATEENLRRPYALQGRLPDSELAPVGLAQARAAAEAVSRLGISRVFASPLKRAVATAAAIALELDVPLEIVEGLIEADVGQWACLTWDEIERRWPDEFHAFQNHADRHGYLGGENITQVRDRVLPVVEGLVARHPGECILVVAHGVVNRALVAHWFGLPLNQARRLPYDNTGFSRIEFDAGNVRVRSLNESTHLAGTCRAA